MLMLECTKVLRPGLPRIGQIGNMVLPRTIDLKQLMLIVGGAIFGLMVGLMLRPLGLGGSFIATTMPLGAALFMLLGQWQPWKGESAATVVLTRASAAHNTIRSLCPGTGMILAYEADTGSQHCPKCRRVFEGTAGRTPTHDWRRRIYVGVMPVKAPVLGVVTMRQGWREVAPVQNGDQRGAVRGWEKRYQKPATETD